MTKLSLRKEIEDILIDELGGEEYHDVIYGNISSELLDKILSLVEKQVLESLPKEKVYSKLTLYNLWSANNEGFNDALKQVKQNIHKIFKGD